MQIEHSTKNGVLEEFRIEFLDCWRRLPNKSLFLGLLAAWLALFHFLGNSTFGYVNTPSLLCWMYNAYRPPVDISATDDGHGLLIPFIVLGLMWWKRKELMAVAFRTWLPGLGMVGLGLVLHLLGYVGQQQRVSVAGMFLGIYGLMGVVWGPGWLRAIFFPFFLFAFSVPLGTLAEPITFPMRLLVCRLVEFISVFLSIDVVRHGTQLINAANHYQYDVAPACSGIRSLVFTIVMATVLGFVSFRSWWKRLVMIASAFPLAVLGNLIRLLLIVFAAELGGQSWGDYMHESSVFKLLPYVPAFLGLLWIESLLLRGRAPGTEGGPSIMNLRKLTILIAALLMMGGAAAVLARVKTSQKLGQPGIHTSVLPDSQRLQVDLPEQVLDYTSEPGKVEDIAVSVLPKDTSFGRRFYKAPDGLQLDLSVVLMGSDRTSIHKPQLCLRGSGLEIRNSEKVLVPVKSPYAYNLPVTKLTVSPEKAQASDPSSGVYVYWFVADREYTGDHLQRMWWLFRDVMTTGVLPRWAYIYCFAPCAPGQEEAVFGRMKEFIAAAAPQFQLGAPPPADENAPRN